MTASGPLRIVFMGTPDFAVAALDALATSAHRVVAAYTRAPKPRGRGQSLQPSPVQVYAQARNIPVYHPRTLKSPEVQAEFAALRPDVAVVAAYGLILPPAILDAPRYGCLNVHASLLPRWRGAAPIQRALLAADTATGISIMQMDAGLDTGPVIASRPLAIHPHTTAASLHDALAALGAAMIEETVDRLAREGGLEADAQDDSLATYAPMLRKEEGRIDWSRPAEEIDRQVRAFTPWPSAWTPTARGKTLKILGCVPEREAAPDGTAPGTVLDRSGRVVCGAGSVLRLERVQPDSARAMDVSSAVNGGHLRIGERLGEPAHPGDPSTQAL